MVTADDDQSNFEEAWRRIAHAKATGADLLDLGDLGLTDSGKRNAALKLLK